MCLIGRAHNISMFGFYMSCYSVAKPNQDFVWHYMKLSIYDWFIQFEPKSLWGFSWWEIETDRNQDEAYFNSLVPVGWSVSGQFEDDQSDTSTTNSDELDWDMLDFSD